jgi:hypothetical protein
MVAGKIVHRRNLAPPTRLVAVRLDGCTDAFVNQLRWCLTRDIPTLALKTVNIIQTSPFPDEYIAHRIGLMPFRPKDINATAAEMRLEVRTPGRVLARHIEGSVEALTPNQVVTTLPRECFIKLHGVFDLACGKVHQRYNHVACAHVSRRSDGMDDRVDECWCVDTPPGEVCADCAGVKCKNPGATVHHMLHFETFGVKEPDEVLREAIIITRAKLDRIAVQLRASRHWRRDAPRDAAAVLPSSDAQEKAMFVG